jgi:translocon-associated protein subunit alpha
MANTLKLFAVFLMCLVFGAIAQDDAEVEYVEVEESETVESFAGASQDADVVSVFPAGKVTIGEINDFLMLFSNNGDKKFNVTAIEAGFTYPQDLTYYIQNFTRVPYHIAVNPNEQTSFTYYFRPDPMFDAMKVGFVGVVFYSDEDGVSYATTFVNKTMDIEEAVTGFDIRNIFTYLLALAILGLAGFLVFNSLGLGKKGGKKSTRSTSDSATGGLGDSSEWLKGTNVGAGKKSPTLRTRKTPAK